MENTLREILKRNLEGIQEKIERALERASRKKGEVKILGASKGQSPEKIRLLYEYGIKLFGENYVQSAEKKIKELKDLPLEWHFIGRLQTNKVKKALQIFQIIESIDRWDLVVELEKRLKPLGKVFPVFIEVNIGEEPTKGGVKPSEIYSFCERIREISCLEVCGLMGLPPYFEDPEKLRPFFVKMRELFEKVKPLFGDSFKELSMGTSNDFFIAIEEGATIVRIGTLLFGPRK